ncbi:unnamed protein product [Cochlearia groenlandica]
MSLSGLHKFKLFAADRRLKSSAATNPAMSPTKSPVFHLRGRKTTLRTLFEKSSDGRSRRNLRQILEESPESDCNSAKKKRGNHRARRKLKELMVTSPSPPFRGGEERRSEISSVSVGSVSVNGDGREITARRLVTSGSVQSFRFRILRKPWRPVLVSIPEQ